MNISILFLGKTKEKYLAQGISDYGSRLKRYVNVEIKTIKERKGAVNERVQIQEEGTSLLKNTVSNAFVVALDPKGKELSSEQLADLFSKWEMQGKQNVSFIIGGPLGLSEEVKARANFILSLSRMTFTHEIARFLLVEQLYRSFGIKAGSKYHK